MPLIIPIQSVLVPESTVEGILAGSTDITGDLTVNPGLRGNLIGSTQMTGALGGKLALAGNLIGSTDLVGFLRINDEPNIFLEGELQGSTEMAGNLTMQAGFGGELAGSTQMTGDLTVKHPTDPTITILADIFDSTIVTAQNARLRRYTARLLVDGSPVAIRRATLEARADTLGTELRVTLLVPDAALISETASLTFQIGLWDHTSDSFIWMALLSGGRLSALNNALRNDSGRPADEVTLSIVDVVADRWNRAPRQPVHLHDPDTSPAPAQSDLSANRIEVYGGGFIEQLDVAIAGMTLYQVLNYAYVTGCGFSSVVCSIPNFPVSEADFTLDGGYDAGVRSLLSLFQPVLFERENVLYIVDPDAPLPAGMTPRDFTHAQTTELADSLPQHEPVNALLVKVRSAGGGEYFTERLDTETKTAGVFGSDGWSETDVERRVREYRNFSAPLVVVREEVVSERTRVHDGGLNLIEETLETISFDAFNRRTGSVKSTRCLLPLTVPEGELATIRDSSGAVLSVVNAGHPELIPDVLKQVQTVTYTTDPRDPSRDLQDRVVTVQSGQIVVDEDNQYLGKAYKIPALDAHRSGYVDPAGNQHYEFGDIRTTIEQLRVRGEQVDVETRVIDHISDVPIRNATTTRPATASTSRKQQSSGRTVLLTISGTESVGRRAKTLDAGELPFDIAIGLGQRKLARLNNPPRDVSLTPAYIDLAIRRGSVLQLKKRGGAALGNYIVLGYSIEFEQFAQSEGGARARMSATAREILQ